MIRTRRSAIAPVVRSFQRPAGESVCPRTLVARHDRDLRPAGGSYLETCRARPRNDGRHAEERPRSRRADGLWPALSARRLAMRRAAPPSHRSDPPGGVAGDQDFPVWPRSWTRARRPRVATAVTRSSPAAAAARADTASWQTGGRRARITLTPTGRATHPTTRPKPRRVGLPTGPSPVRRPASLANHDRLGAPAGPPPASASRSWRRSVRTRTIEEITDGRRT